MPRLNNFARLSVKIFCSSAASCVHHNNSKPAITPLKLLFERRNQHAGLTTDDFFKTLIVMPAAQTNHTACCRC